MRIMKDLARPNQLISSVGPARCLSAVLLCCPSSIQKLPSCAAAGFFCELVFARQKYRMSVHELEFCRLFTDMKVEDSCVLAEASWNGLNIVSPPHPAPTRLLRVYVW